MWAPAICNLLATLSKPPWTTPLNWNLQMTLNGEERIPFHLYVQPCSSSRISSFPDFIRLPAELQLRILAFCSAPTLYQIMRTCRLRTEAEKLFWADPNTYYLIGAYWLFGGGHSADTYYDLSFMAYVQNVEIEYDICSDEKIGPIRDDVFELELDYERAREFWKTFQTRFPRAKRVVVNQNWESLSIRQRDDEPVACCLKALIEVCPATIDVLAFVLVEVQSGGCKRTARPVASNWHRVLYQLADDGGWKKVTASNFERKTILMPSKRFHGPVGEYEGLFHESDRIYLKQLGLWALAIEALDRHYFDKEDPEPFHCPASGCDVYFEKAGQWTQHAAEAHSTDSADPQFDILPDALQRIFKERKNKLEQDKEAVRRKYEKIYNDWNEEGGEKRRELERGWIYQLENDEAWNTGVKGTESGIWNRFAMHMDPRCEI